jgi:hypothetical protein
MTPTWLSVITVLWPRYGGNAYNSGSGCKFSVLAEGYEFRVSHYPTLGPFGVFDFGFDFGLGVRTAFFIFAYPT